ncbi:hypothetical protein [Rhizobium tubonense]|uniref:Uncharacterized protein n=1 Tax=Rhizobium tubonense TaxID=484088 RepID=A0A2W4CUC9_9HYPH|nr:hypothetical protein [Rhizobium tubonense]PZM13915.1 hypothetical protein CPY51_13740 [Rhizobium tubonense]
MRFGQSVFQSVLERLDAEDAEDGESPASAYHRIHGLNSSFVADVREGVSAASIRPGQAYIDNLEFEEPSPVDAARPEEPPQPAAPEPPPLVMPAHLTRTAPQDVAAELAISSGDTQHSLNDKRRAFAKANHPDGVAPPFRENATARMMIANLLIDEALRRISRQR